MFAFLRKLSVNQMIALVVVTLVILLVAVVAYSIANTPPDPFTIPTATLPPVRMDGQFQFGNVTPTPAP